MKFVSFSHGAIAQAALLIDKKVYPLSQINPEIPATMKGILEDWESNKSKSQIIHNEIISGKHSEIALEYYDLNLLAPVPQPSSCRDGYAFRQHVAAARRNRKVPMIEGVAD